MLKKVAKDLFVSKQYEDAIKLYRKVIFTIECSQEKDITETQEGQEILWQSRLNIALCFIYLKKCDEAIRICNKVIQEHRNNYKAYYRLAMAKYEKTNKEPNADEMAIIYSHVESASLLSFCQGIFDPLLSQFAQDINA